MVFAFVVMLFVSALFCFLAHTKNSMAVFGSAACAFAAHYAKTYPIFQNLKQQFAGDVKVM